MIVCDAAFGPNWQRVKWCGGCYSHPGGDNERVCTHKYGHQPWCPQCGGPEELVLRKTLHFLVATLPIETLSV